MDFNEVEIKKYEKKHKKKTKSGKIREIIRFQYIIPLKQDNPYKTEKTVYILTKNELNELLSIINDYKLELTEIKEENKKLKNKNDVLSNKHDHLQARFNKCQEELNIVEREFSDLRVIVTKIEKRSFLDRVLNRLPEEIKALEGRRKI